MNKKLLLLIVSCIASLCFSQKLKQRVEIQENKNSYPDKTYFFSSVMDARQNQEEIGIIYKADLKTRYRAELKHPLQVELRSFLKDVFPYEPDRQLVLIIINEFRIGQTLSRTDTGFVRVNFDFYRIRNDSVSFISNYTGRLADPILGESPQHNNRMKRAILYAVKDMEGHINHIQSPYQPLSMLSQIRKSSNIHPGQQITLSNAENGALSISDRIEDSLQKRNFPNRCIVMIGAHANLCVSTFMPGLGFSALFRLASHPKTLIGFSTNYSLIKWYNATDISLPSNTISYKIRTSDLGFRLLRQFRKNLFYNLQAHALIGIEQFETYDPNIVVVNGVALSKIYDVSNIFVGMQLDNGVYFLIPRGCGAYVGLDVVIRMTNSDVFDADGGIRFSAGIKF